MTSVDSNFNFCVDVHMGLDLPYVHMHPPEPDPLRVDVINGWPLITSGIKRTDRRLGLILQQLVYVIFDWNRLNYRMICELINNTIGLWFYLRSNSV